MIKRKKRIAFAAVCAALILGFLLYAGIYYHADETAAAAMGSDGTVTVTRTDYGWLLDGPSADDALVFYPGAKVEETAYMPLLHRLAAEGMDVCLVKMPLRFAFFAPNRADDLIEEYGYSHWYIGGHSLGGAIAANYAAGHPELLDGVILLAAYPTKELDDDLLLLSLYGSEDGVLNMEKLTESDRFAPDRYIKREISGGNHAGFGNYGAQRGDGEAAISAEEQQEQTVDLILESTGND